MCGRRGGRGDVDSMIAETTKACKVCGQRKRLSDYYERNKVTCKACYQARERAYRKTAKWKEWKKRRLELEKARRAIARHKRQEQAVQARLRACPMCNGMFLPVRKSIKYCSIECSIEGRRRGCRHDMPQTWTDAIKAALRRVEQVNRKARWRESNPYRAKMNRLARSCNLGATMRNPKSDFVRRGHKRIACHSQGNNDRTFGCAIEQALKRAEREAGQAQRNAWIKRFESLTKNIRSRKRNDRRRKKCYCERINDNAGAAEVQMRFEWEVVDARGSLG